MPGLSKVIVLDPDGRAGRQIQLGFQREGVRAELVAVPAAAGAAIAVPDEAGLVIVGGAGDGAVELVQRARRALHDAELDAPIVFAGRGVRRPEVEAAGADEVVLAPAYLRDIVTIGRLLLGQPTGHRAHLVGSLVETTGVLTLVRALAALGRSAVLTLIRGLRRGEVRFYRGEVTSAQVGLIHGQAALHQLLLWTDARFDFHHEDVVRRHQIPLERDELYADAERFLAGVRDSSGTLSPAMVLEQDVPRVQGLGTQVPTEVFAVLRMFDGHRVLADVLEDSPYRVFETLRVTQLAVAAGLLRETTAPRPRATWRAVLAIEEWLVGAETREDVLERHAGVDSGPVPRTALDERSGRHAKSRGSRRKRKKRRAVTPLAVTPALARPDIDWGSLVPRAANAEVGPLASVVPVEQTSGEITPREGLEALMDTGQRDRIFPMELRAEPTVVWDEAATAPVTAKAVAAPEPPAPEPTAPEATAPEPTAPEPTAPEPTASEATASEATASEATELVRQLVADQSDGDPIHGAPTDRMAAMAEEMAEAERAIVAHEKAAAAERAAAEQAAAERAAAERAAAVTASAPVAVTGEVAIAGAARAAGPAIAEPAIVVEDPELASVVIERVSTKIVSGELVAPLRRAATVRDEPAPRRDVPAAPPVIIELPASELERAAAPVGETIDEPSDGVIRQTISVAETAPTPRRPSGEIPVDDRPEDATGEIQSDSGERPAMQPVGAEPTILVADLAVVHAAVSAAFEPPSAPIAGAPALAAPAPAPAAPAPAAATPSIATAAADREVAALRDDAAAFTESEEAFFRAGHHAHALDDGHAPARAPAIAHDSFDDLDEGYRPVGFWDRFLGRKPKS